MQLLIKQQLLQTHKNIRKQAPSKILAFGAYILIQEINGRFYKGKRSHLLNFSQKRGQMWSL